MQLRFIDQEYGPIFSVCGSQQHDELPKPMAFITKKRVLAPPSSHMWIEVATCIT
jgi:hypothetical protein